MGKSVCSYLCNLSFLRAVMVMVKSDGSRDKGSLVTLFHTHRGWSSLLLKVLLRALRVSGRGGQALSIMANNLSHPPFSHLFY